MHAQHVKKGTDIFDTKTYRKKASMTQNFSNHFKNLSSDVKQVWHHVSGQKKSPYFFGFCFSHSMSNMFYRR